MATPKGKRLTFALCALAFVLVAGGALWRQREIRERWHLWRLETGDEKAKIAAMVALGELKSTRALPELAKVLAGDSDPLGLAALAAGSAIGPEAAEVLFEHVQMLEGRATRSFMHAWAWSALLALRERTRGAGSDVRAAHIAPRAATVRRATRSNRVESHIGR